MLEPKKKAGNRQGSHQCDPPISSASDLPTFVSVILELLAKVLRGQDEIRQQLAGHVKSHQTVEEVAHLVGRAPYTVRQYIKQGKINAIRVAGSGPRGRLLVPREEVAKLLEMGAGGNVPAVATPQQ